MIAKNRAQLKAWIKNMSARVEVNENIILQNYMLERLLERISVSDYKYKFVLKGGMLITAIVGIDMRNTLDMDATIKGFNLEKDNLEDILNEIFSIDLDDEVIFEFRNIKEIRQEDEYGGYRVSLDAKFDKLVVPMKLDITTGDVIVPKEVNYKFGLMFEDRSIEILAYNMETVIADKFETIISRNIDTTRARDFYDIYILWTTQQQNFDKELLGQAIVKKFEYRDSIDKLNNIDEIMEVIKESNALKEHWKNYHSKFSYAEDINYEDTIRVFDNDNIKEKYEEYYKYIKLLDKVNTEKIETNSTYLNGYNTKVYRFNNESELLLELRPLFNFLNLKERVAEINTQIIPQYGAIRLKILKEFKEKLVTDLTILKNEDIIKFGSKMGKIVEKEQIEKYYFPILRNIRHPLKKTKNIFDDSTKIDIYKERVISEYNFKENIEIVTGLNFYQDYKQNLLGTKEKREKTSKFEKFLSNYFFNGESISIIPDEETFELKININDEEDRFIYQVGDGITSLLIIMYTIFMECDSSNYKLFCIEEPESNFHPGFQRLFINMITYFKEFEKCIFILSTHSNNLIDIGNRENKTS